MQVRKLNQAGIEKFNEYIDSLSQGNYANYPKYLLEDSRTSDALNIKLSIDENIQFSSRYEIGLYLNGLFKRVDIHNLLGEQGFWSWFSLVWFEQLCPVKDGKLSPRKAYNYILSRKYNHRPRHSIYMTWLLVNKHGADSKFLLSKAPYTRGELTEQMMARQDIFSMIGVIKLASILYYDNKTGIFKRGAGGRGAGCVSRYVSWLQQLQVTYDIFSMSEGELKKLLPKEFNRFIDNSDRNPLFSS